MYKCRVTYDEWKSMKKKSRTGRFIQAAGFEGYVGLLSIEEVSEPQEWDYHGAKITVLDRGYKWLTILPKDAYYCITVMMDDAYKIKVSYIDLIDAQGMDEDGTPYFFDCYLDLIVYPDGSIIVDDRDELDAALAEGDITEAQYDRTIQTADGLQNGLLKNYDAYCLFVQKRLFQISGS